MSEYRIKQYKSERSRASFGIEQKTRYKMFPNKKSIGYVSGFSAMAIYCNEME